MNRRHAMLSGFAMAAVGCVTRPNQADLQALRQQVAETEIAFARTMSERDFAAFLVFVSEEAVFLNGGKPLRGKAAVSQRWKSFFDGPQAPFTWRPDLVEVLASGTLAQSIGPVFAPGGELIARFYSTWRLDAPGVWRIVFDNGYDVCNCAKP